MDPSLRTAASGMIAQQKRIEVISNNLSNVNTTAFKRSRAHFEDLLYQTVQGASSSGAGGDSVGGVQIGRGTRLSAVRRMDAQGSIQITQRPLDLAIDGEGYFQVELPNGTMAYSRDGSFNRTEQGRIVTSGGYALVPPTILPREPGGLSVSSGGVVMFQAERGGEPLEVGRIELARFTNPTGLESLGENLYGETASSGPPLLGSAQEQGFGRLIAGALESSNVEIVQEMVEMIAAQRAYEIGSRAISTGEEMARTTNQLGR